MQAMDTYLREINKAYGREDSTEHTHRGALARLVEGMGKKVTAINEPKRIECGAPDVVVPIQIYNMATCIFRINISRWL